MQLFSYSPSKKSVWKWKYRKNCDKTGKMHQNVTNIHGQRPFLCVGHQHYDWVCKDWHENTGVYLCHINTKVMSTPHCLSAELDASVNLVPHNANINHATTVSSDVKTKIGWPQKCWGWTKRRASEIWIWDLLYMLNSRRKCTSRFLFQNVVAIIQLPPKWKQLWKSFIFLLQVGAMYKME